MVLNDNEMSIAPPVGGLSSYLPGFTPRGRFRFLKAVVGCGGLLPPPCRGARRAKEMLAGMTVGGTLFEELAFSYVGLVDGHDLDQLLPLLRTVKGAGDGPVLIHAVTKKGKGYARPSAPPTRAMPRRNST